MLEKGVVLKAEDLADRLFSSTRLFLPLLARICLISSFLEDCVRMATEWSAHVDDIQHRWNCGVSEASVVILIFLFGELLGCVMILQKKKTPLACCILVLAVLLQTITFASFNQYSLGIIVCNLVRVGAVLMVFADSKAETHSSAPGVPTLESDNPKNLFQLSGRCLLMFMFVILLEFGSTTEEVIHDVVAIVLMTLVILGYKTRLSAFVLMIVLTLMNFYENSWWLEPDGTPQDEKDYIRYEFFLGLTAVGGLLMILLHGPGDLSVDARKKRY